MNGINGNITRRTDQYLHRNRIVLVELSKRTRKQKFFVPRYILTRMGFRFNYYTGSKKNNEGKMYRFIYDFAWMEFSSQEIMVIKRRVKEKIMWR